MRYGILSLALPIIAVSLASSFLYAQPSGERPGFEAASMRANVGGAENMGAFAQPGGRFGARNVTVEFLIRNAYDVKDFQIISAGFSWINLDRYDINAKALAGTPDGFEPIRPMLQTLLSDRFKLRFHRERKEVSVYDLVIAKAGLKVATSRDVNCGPADPKNPRPRETAPFCDNVRTGRGVIEAYGVTMTRFSNALSGALDRMVIDKTGFAGIFDGNVRFATDASPVNAQPSPRICRALPFLPRLRNNWGLNWSQPKGSLTSWSSTMWKSRLRTDFHTHPKPKAPGPAERH